MSSKQMGQCRQKTKTFPISDRSVTRKVKMAATSRTQMTWSLKLRNWSAQLWQITRCHSMYTHCRQWHTDGILSDHWRPTSEGRGTACTWDHGQTSECWWWVERQHSLHAVVSLLWTSAHQPAGGRSSWHDW